METVYDYIDWKSISTNPDVEKPSWELLETLVRKGIVEKSGELQPSPTAVSKLTGEKPQDVTAALTQLSKAGVLTITRHAGSGLPRRFRIARPYFTPPFWDGVGEATYAEALDLMDMVNDEEAVDAEVLGLERDLERIKAQLKRAKARQVLNLAIKVPRPLCDRVDALRGEYSVNEVVIDVLTAWCEEGESR